MRKIIILVSLLVLCSSLYTSSYWTSRGINVEDGKIQTEQIKLVSLDTICQTVDVRTGPLRYNGIVKSGYLRVGKGNSSLGFIFYGKEDVINQNDLSKYPVIIWLNGGPGSSSQLGNFMELGPYWVVPNATQHPYITVKNPNAWTKNYNLLFVDQPIGTGFSYADPSIPHAYCQSMTDVANDFWFALKELYQSNNGCFKQLNINGNQDLIIFGESYAGKYVPAIANKIKTQQQSGGFLTGLKGIGIGDGFTMPYIILSQVGSYAYNLGLLDYQQRARVEQMIINSTFQQRVRDWRDLHLSFDRILDYIVEKAGKINVYDITKYHDYPTPLLEQFLNDPATQKTFNFNPDIPFKMHSNQVYEALFDDFMKPQATLVQALLARKVFVLIYNGQNDLIVQTPGTFKWVDFVHYDQAQKFRDTLFSVWKTGNITSGYKKQAGYLELRTVNNAGHLVPMDQGQASLNMVTEFVKKCTGK